MNTLLVALCLSLVALPAFAGVSTHSMQIACEQTENNPNTGCSGTYSCIASEWIWMFGQLVPSAYECSNQSGPCTNAAWTARRDFSQGGCDCETAGSGCVTWECGNCANIYSKSYPQLDKPVAPPATWSDVKRLYR